MAVTTGCNNLTPLPEFKKMMLTYAKTSMTFEDGQTPLKWVNAYIKQLEKDGSIVTLKGKKYVVD